MTLPRYLARPRPYTVAGRPMLLIPIPPDAKTWGVDLPLAREFLAQYEAIRPWAARGAMGAIDTVPRMGPGRVWDLSWQKLYGLCEFVDEIETWVRDQSDRAQERYRGTPASPGGMYIAPGSVPLN